MKKKFVILFLSIACALCLAFAFAGCTDENGESSNSGSNTQQGGQDGGSEDSGETDNATDDQGSDGHKHNFGEFVPEQPATCTEAGRKGYYFCADCNKYFDVQKNELGDLTIPAKGHNYISVCEQTEHWRSCTVCGEEEAHTAHSVTDGVCHTCGYVEKCTAGLKFTAIKENGVTVAYWASNGTANDAEIFIPSFHENLPVTIGVFLMRTNIISVTIGNGVTSIGDQAFAGCSNLAAIEIPDSVTSIGSSAFGSCTNLTSITIPNSVTSIGNHAFSGCNKLVEVINLSDLPIEKGEDTYGWIAKYALNVINSPEQSKIRYSQDYVYYEDGDTVYLLGYKGNNTVLQLPDKLGGKTYDVYGFAFYGNDKITEVTIPAGVTSIGDGAFSVCARLISITIDESNTAYSSRDGILYDKNRTTLIQVLATKSEVTIPDSVTSIGNYAFVGCTSIESITIPDGVTSIGDWAFYGCSTLTSVTISDGVTSIGEYAFMYCGSLESVYITDIAAWCNIDFEDDDSNPLYYAHNLYLNNNLITELTAEMLQGVTKIKDYAFYNCKSLQSVTIPDSVTSIGDWAFYGCTSLTSITIPNSVTSIGECAFSDCTNLKNITFNNPNGWYVTKDSSATSGTDIKSEDLQDPETAATYLKDTYINYYWKRKTT